VAKLLTIKVCELNLTKMPPDMPRGGKQNHTYSMPPDTFFRKGAEKLSLLGSITAKKSNLCSIIVSCTTECFTGSSKPYIFQNCPSL
jgi:hypothetical protein